MSNGKREGDVAQVLYGGNYRSNYVRGPFYVCASGRLVTHGLKVISV